MSNPGRANLESDEWGERLGDATRSAGRQLRQDPGSWPFWDMPTGMSRLPEDRIGGQIREWYLEVVDGRAYCSVSWFDVGREDYTVGTRRLVACWSLLVAMVLEYLVKAGSVGRC